MSESRAFPAGSAVAGIAGATTPPTSLFVPGSLRWVTADASGICQRLVVLFLFRALFKLSLILSQSRGLYEAHWRIAGQEVTWLNYLAFGGFVLLGPLCLLVLGKECSSTGVRTVRAVNASLLILGLSFIFLTFHNGNKNYIYPILSGVLRWNSLGPYVANSLFFDPPFLGAWLFVYALTYYVLARTGRERSVLFVTAAFGCVYGLLNLRRLLV
ncbi:MAG TPA: hypothetical protein VGR89_12855, partial [Puia sp.]|nr:hypothetical protein [Puia sp.]